MAVNHTFRRTLSRLGILTALVGGSLALTTQAGAVPLPVPPFNECPAVGQDASCALLIDVTGSGTQVLGDTSQGAFDGSDDTLLGIINQSSTPLSSIPLSSPTGLTIFGFESDGICQPGLYPAWGPAPASTTVIADTGSKGCQIWPPRLHAVWV